MKFIFRIMHNKFFFTVNAISYTLHAKDTTQNKPVEQLLIMTSITSH